MKCRNQDITSTSLSVESTKSLPEDAVRVKDCDKSQVAE